MAVTSPTESAAFEVGGRRYRQLGYDDRKQITYDFRLANSGPVGVTVTRIRLRSVGRYLLLTPVGFALGKPSGPSAFESFSIAASDSRPVVLAAYFANCEFVSPRAASLVTDVRVDYRVAGISRHAVVALPETLRIGSPPVQGCPRATLSSRPPG